MLRTSSPVFTSHSNMFSQTPGSAEGFANVRKTRLLPGWPRLEGVEETSWFQVLQPLFHSEQLRRPQKSVTPPTTLRTGKQAQRRDKSHTAVKWQSCYPRVRLTNLSEEQAGSFQWHLRSKTETNEEMKKLLYKAEVIQGLLSGTDRWLETGWSS